MGEEKKGSFGNAIAIIIAYILVLALWTCVDTNLPVAVVMMTGCGIVFYVISYITKKSNFFHNLALYTAFWAGGIAFASAIQMILKMMFGG